MTEPPAAPRPDPTADPPPFSSPQGPPYPSEGGGYPTYLPGSARVEPPPAYPQTDPEPTASYPPLTAVPGYPRSSRGRVLGITAAVLALALCGLAGIGAYLSVSGNGVGTRSEAQAAPSSAPSERPTGRPSDLTTDLPNWLPSGLPSWLPLPELPDGAPHTVRYAVTGDGPTATVAYRTAEDLTVEQVDLPWQTEVRLDTFFLVLTAYGPSGTQVSCQISVDGEQVATMTGRTAVCASGPAR